MITELSSILASNNSIMELNNDEHIKSLLHNEYSDAFNSCINKGTYLYRGTNEIYLYKAENELINERHIAYIKIPNERISITDNNVLNILLSGVLPSWKGYQKRNKSICMTFSHYIASLYSDNIYYVFPKNGASLCMTDTACIQGYKMDKYIDNFFGNLATFIECVSQLISLIIDEKIDFTNITAKQLKDVLHKADIKVKNDPEIFNTIKNTTNYSAQSITHSDVMQFIKDLMTNPLDIAFTSFIDLFNEMLSPKALNVTKININDINSSNKTQQKELWTESTCLLINKTYFDTTILNKKITTGNTDV